MNVSKVIENKYFFILASIFVIFLLLRLPGFDIPYHQDEYKWPLYAEEKVFAPGTIPHPPLTEFIYRVIGKNIGLDNFRAIPLVFSTFNLFLIAYLAKIIFDKETSLIASGIFAFSFFSILASLTVDVDGAVMVFFFLLMSIGYYKLRSNKFSNLRANYIWMILFSISAVFGFLIKVSFFIGILALVIDFAFERRLFADKRKLVKFGAYLLGVVAALALVLFLIKLIFPYFDVSKALRYWEHFINFKSRGWLQILIQGLKSIMYLSPLLIFAPLFVKKEDLRILRPFLLYITIGLVFYFVLFDFSVGALDRYLAFLVVPLILFAARAISLATEDKTVINRTDVFVVLTFTVITFLIQFKEHFVPFLHPKTEWISRVFSLRWDFLYPFSGGSGPLPFYISFLFVALFFILSLVFVIFAVKNRSFKKQAIFALFVFSLVYNLTFAEEYLFGKINGSARNLIKGAVQYIKENDDINKVLVYNDNGGFDIYRMGKYERRIYAVPEFEDTYRKVFENFGGHIMFVNIPRLNPESFYSKYFETCKIVRQEKDRYIESRILSCKK